MALCEGCRIWFATALAQCYIPEAKTSLPDVTVEDLEAYNPQDTSRNLPDSTATTWPYGWLERDYEFDRPLEPMIEKSVCCWMCCWFCLRYRTIKSHSPDEYSVIRDDGGSALSKTLRPLVSLDKNGNRLLAITIRLSFELTEPGSDQNKTNLYMNLSPNGDTYYFQMSTSLDRSGNECNDAVDAWRQIRYYQFLEQEASHPVLVSMPGSHSDDVSGDLAKSEHSQCSPYDTSCSCRVGLTKKWLQACLKDHSMCHVGIPDTIEGSIPGLSTAFLPTRLIEIGDEHGTARLVELNSISDTDSIRYATLSHCWGTKQLVVLTESNKPLFLDSIPTHTLGRTFREAIDFCRHLSITYIWIDCLCIIQDSRADWQAEASRMHHVYGNSLINLSATASRDADGGLLPANNDVLHDSIRVRLPNGMVLREVFYISGNSRRESFSRCPLLQRGWVLQECFLAPRILHCSPAQMIWQCKQLAASEIDNLIISPDAMGDLNMRLERFLFYDTIQSATTAKQLDDVWLKVAKDFAETDVTRQEDRYYALSGVAALINARYRHLALETRYVAGSWTHFLLRMISFQHAQYGDSLGSSAVQFPSWSWLRMKYPRFESDIPPHPRNLKIHDVIVDYETEELQYGPVVTARIIATGIKFTVESILRHTSVGEDGEESLRFEHTFSRKKHKWAKKYSATMTLRSGRLDFDEPTNEEGIRNMKCIVLYIEEQIWQSDGLDGSLSVRSLIVNQLPRERGRRQRDHRRLGVFDLSVHRSQEPHGFDTMLEFFCKNPMPAEKVYIV